MVTTPRCQCRGHGLDPWSGNQDSTCHWVRSKDLEILKNIYIKKTTEMSINYKESFSLRYWKDTGHLMRKTISLEKDPDAGKD